MDRNSLLNDNEASLRLALDGRQSTIWTAIPCIVESVDFSNMTIEAQPAIQGTVLKEDGTEQAVNLPLLVDVPLVFPSAGGYILTFPIAEGDEVLVVFASRCIDAWWQNGGIGRPMEMRMHDLSDGFAIPGPRSVPNAVEGISEDSVQLRNDAGTTYIEISDDGKIKLVSPSMITLDAPEIVLDGNVSVTGTLDVTGAITTDASILAIGDITGANFITAGGVTAGGAIAGATMTAGGVALATHTHAAGSLTSPSGAVTGATGAPL